MEFTIKFSDEVMEKLLPILFSNNQIEIKLEDDKIWAEKLTKALRKTESSAFVKAIQENLKNY